MGWLFQADKSHTCQLPEADYFFGVNLMAVGSLWQCDECGLTQELVTNVSGTVKTWFDGYPTYKYTWKRYWKE